MRSVYPYCQNHVYPLYNDTPARWGRADTSTAGRLCPRSIQHLTIHTRTVDDEHPALPCILHYHIS